MTENEILCYIDGLLSAPIDLDNAGVGYRHALEAVRDKILSNRKQL